MRPFPADASLVSAGISCATVILAIVDYFVLLGKVGNPRNKISMVWNFVAIIAKQLPQIVIGEGRN
jgi:hypothetical protein